MGHVTVRDQTVCTRTPGHTVYAMLCSAGTSNMQDLHSVEKSRD